MEIILNRYFLSDFKISGYIRNNAYKNNKKFVIIINKKMETQSNTTKIGRGRPKGSTKFKNVKNKTKTKQIKNNKNNNKEKIKNKILDKKLKTENIELAKTDENNISEKIKTKNNAKIINLKRDPNSTKIPPIFIKIW